MNTTEQMMMTSVQTKAMGEIMSLQPANRIIASCLLVGILLLGACSSLNPYVDRKSDISLDKAKKIQINITTRESLIKDYGEPYVRGLKNGNEVLIFVGSIDGQHSSMEVKLNDKGIVTEYTFFEENPRRASK
jgi:hypothetical protein